jgi:hypothetical protein
MTESQEKLLAVFETRIHDLLALCDQQKQMIDNLTQILNQEKENVQQSKEEILSLKAKYANLLTARIAWVDAGDMKSASGRLQKLVREVDKCIALLNG